MKARLAVFVAVLLGFATPAFAHRLDEYLQATTVALARSSIVLQLRLTPGVDVAPAVLSGIDADEDGVFSEAEQRSYAERVAQDLSLAVDGEPLTLRLISSSFPPAAELTNGAGNILLEFEADMPPGGSTRRLTLENRHQRALAVYLVNCLMPRDPGIHVIAQNRNYDQSFYRLDFTVSDEHPNPQQATARAGLNHGSDQKGGSSPNRTSFWYSDPRIFIEYDHLMPIGAFLFGVTLLWNLAPVRGIAATIGLGMAIMTHRKLRTVTLT